LRTPCDGSRDKLTQPVVDRAQWQMGGGWWVAVERSIERRQLVV